MTLGSSVECIESSAFAGCKNLETVTCYATKVPNTSSDVFNEAYVEYATLLVPALSVAAYSSTSPWKDFGNIEAIDGGNMEKCAAPVITCINGKISATSTTPEAKCHITYTYSGSGEIDNNASPSITVKVTAYATADGYIQSEMSTATFEISQSGNDNATAEIEALEGENNVLKNENASLQTENDDLKNENASLQTENDDLKNENASLKTENTTLKSENSSLHTENNELKNECSSLKTDNAFYEIGDLNMDGHTDINDVIAILTNIAYESGNDALAQLSEGTAITTAEIEEKWGDVEYYTLGGVKVTEPKASGIYIVKKNGKTKMIVVKK